METFVYGLNQASPNLKTVLTRLCRLYGVYNILQHTGDYLQVLKSLSKRLFMGSGGQRL